MKKIITKRILLFLLITLLFGTGIVYASYVIISKTVIYTPGDNSWNVNNVEDAIDDLYYYYDKNKDFNASKITWNYDFSGSVKEFVIPKTGTYKIEVWGAQGNVSSWGGEAGLGGYAVGYIDVSTHNKLYITVGGKNKYNGGGAANGGGGATHIALSNRTDLSSYVSYVDELLIVAGGGGGTERQKAGSGGGYIGGTATQLVDTCTHFATGGSQQTGGTGVEVDGNPASGNVNGSFGQGGSGLSSKDSGTGGGGGYFGGGGTTRCGGGGGGSGYIGSNSLYNKYMVCYDCPESDASSTKTTSVDCTSADPLENCAKEGNGYARITYIAS